MYESRETVKAILRGEDRRVIAVVGPCSIHQRESAIEFAEKLGPLAQEINDRVFVVMRVYFEKPRTTVGWKGLINDPHLNGTFDMSAGLKMAREILLEVNKLRPTNCYRVPRTHYTTVHRRFDHHWFDRSTHHRVADPSSNGQWVVDADWVQE